MKEKPYITCRQLIDFIAGYLEGSLPPETCREFERHLAACPSCVAYLEGYRQTVRLGKLAFAPTDDSASGVVPEGLINAIKMARKECT